MVQIASMKGGVAAALSAVQMPVMPHIVNILSLELEERARKNPLALPLNSSSSSTLQLHTRRIKPGQPGRVGLGIRDQQGMTAAALRQHRHIL